MRSILFRLAMLLRRLRTRFGRAGRSRELSDEIAFHVELLTRDGVARGMSPEDAHDAARRQFGNRTVLAEEAHDMWSLGSLDDLLRDAKIALRGFRRTPPFAITAVIILGLGIGMAVAMFTVFHAVLLRTLPVQDQNRIAVLWTYSQRGVESSVFPADLEQLRHSSRTMRDIAGVAHWGAFAFALEDGDHSVVIPQARVTGNFFRVLGARPVLGRLLRPDDDVAGAAPVMVISYDTWQRQFGGDSAVIGHRLKDPVQGFSYTIVGVAPPGLDFPTGVGYWGPAAVTGPAALDLIARLAPGETPAPAGAELYAIMQRLHPEQHLIGAEAHTFTQAVVGDVRPVLTVLVAAVVLLLVIACVNVGNLLLLRAAARSREIAVRRALGASYGQVARQLLVESSVLGLAGGALGLACADMLLRVLLALAPAQLPRTDVIRLAGAPVGIAVGVTLLAVLLFGLLPALTAARTDLAQPLRADARSGHGSRGRRRVRQWLVASQVALALVMLAGAALLVRSLDRLEHVDLGYTPDHVSTFVLTFPYPQYNTEAKYMALFERAYARLRVLPSVTALTPVLIPPFLGTSVWTWKPEVDGQTQAEADATPMIPVEAGGAGYFRTFGIPVLRGRGFTDADREGAPLVTVVSEAAARRLWPGQDAIGKRIRYSVLDSTQWRTVVGIAGDIRYRSLRHATPTIYLPWRQSVTQGYFAIRSRSNLATLLPDIRRTLHEIDPQVDIFHAQTMDELLAGPLAEPRMSTLLLSSFGLVALLLAAIGLYGVMASAVREQTHDIGVRMALGATPERIRTGVLTDAATVIGIGALIGLTGALAATRLLTSLLFEVSPADPIALAGACVVLIGIGLVAAYLPARRATRVDPAQVLRAE